MTSTIKLSGAVLSAALLLTACTRSDPVRVEEDFGNSVRNMVKAQTYNPEASRHPPVDPPKRLDGTKGNRALETYRGDVARPAEVEQPIRINIGD
jgi:ABC-type oligopeptide transport system substrate-binding subunit